MFRSVLLLNTAPFYAEAWRIKSPIFALLHLPRDEVFSHGQLAMTST